MRIYKSFEIIVLDNNLQRKADKNDQQVMYLQAYHEPSNLYFSNNSLKSQTGIQQGDPFGPALFSLGVDDITKLQQTQTVY